jgi:uncharacterized lipoprotein YmbA
MRRASRLMLAVVVFVLSMTGCTTFDPKPDPSRFFTLSPLRQVNEDQGRAWDTSERILIGLGPIRLPGYLDRQEIVVRGGPNRFDVLENDHWAEPLDQNFTRVVAQNLSVLLGTEGVVLYPWPRERAPKYQVEIDVFGFETNRAREAQLTARWSILDGSNKKPLQLKDSRLIRAAKETTTDGVVGALSEALGDLSREIADGVKAVDRQLAKP